MPIFERGAATLRYLDRPPRAGSATPGEPGSNGFPLLLFAPGGMRSATAAWKAAPWNPVERLGEDFRIIALDQRNAGRSTAPVQPGDGWHTYTEDHVALLDHLGIDRCHVLGGCIGGSFAFGLIRADPARVTAAVLQQPIGASTENRAAFHTLFDGWAAEIADRHPRMQAADWQAFRSRMYDADFVFNVDRDFVRTCETPLMVLMGNDLYHPEATSREIVELAPDAELIERWKDPEAVEDAVARVRAFLREHTPAS